MSVGNNFLQILRDELTVWAGEHLRGVPMHYPLTLGGNGPGSVSGCHAVRCSTYYYQNQGRALEKVEIMKPESISFRT